MQYVAAYTLASLSGKEPTKEAVQNILKAAGNKFEEAQVNALFDSVGGRPVHELIAKGESKVGSVGGGASAPAPAPAAGKSAPPVEKAKPAEKKPEPAKVEEPEDEDFNLDLFG